MPYLRKRVTLAGCAVVLSCSLLSAGGNPRGNPKQHTVATQSEPVTMVIQMTGLMLLVPPKQANGLTHVLMPNMPPSPGTPDHLTFIGFKGDSTGHCMEYDHDRRICYVDMKGWALDSIGKAAGSSTGAGTAAHGPLNLSRHTNRKINLAQVRDSLASQVTFARGQPTDSCGVAWWTYNPIGQDPPTKFEVINVLEWQIPNMPADSFVLVRRQIQAPYTRDTIATLHTSDTVNNEIELLIMNVLPEDTVGLVRRSRAPQPRVGESFGQAPTAGVQPATPIHTADRHFRALYRLVGVPETMQRLPRRPVRIREACPITILNLFDQYAVDREDKYMGQDEGDSKVQYRGARTLSCIMASAEQI
jgi:hypothetical protein